MLVQKHKVATKSKSEADDALAALEEEIDQDVLTEWKKQEAAWLASVVDMAQHKDLDNPYQPPKRPGE